MGYDDVIPILGNFGRYQRRIYLLLCLPATLCAFHTLSSVFVQAKPNHRCRLPSELQNASYNLPASILNESFSYDYSNQKYSSCSYVKNDTEASCEDYIYDYSKYESTTAMEWNIVCDRSYLSAVSDSIFMLGSLCGAIVFGQLSDRFGRKKTFFISIMIQVAFGVLVAIAPEFWLYTVFRFIVGSTIPGVFLIAYVIGMEMVGSKYRPITGVSCQMFFSLGYMLIALFAFLIHKWRYLQIALTLPGALFLFYWWFIPESTRWLLAKGRLREAKLLIQKAAKVNHVNISDNDLHMLLVSDTKAKKSKQKEVNVFEIFKHPNLRKRSLILCYEWMVNSMTYYGLSWNTSNLDENVSINYLISGVVEIPGYIFLLLTLNRWGRKPILCGSMVTTGVALLLTMAVPKGYHWILITLAMIGKMAVAASFGTVYIFSTEQFPTVVRNAGLGAVSMCARVGSISAPLINLTNEIWKPFPLIIFGTLSLCGGCLSLVLPETLNQKLPETIADGEIFGSPSNLIPEEEKRLKCDEDIEKKHKVNI